MQSTATKTRRSGGCWTCRLRRKKCDENRPLCKACLALEIDCLYGEDKPEWMDGAEKQKQKAEWLKREVKRKATHRRERRYLQGLEVKLESLTVSLTDESDNAAANDLINAAPPSVASSKPSASSPSVSTESTSSAAPDGGLTDSSMSVPSPGELSEAAATPGPSLDFQANPFQESEAHFTMMYLDYVFPFLFPFYRPSFADVGRGWLLVLLTKNKALFHSALSLAGYFYAIVLGHTEDMPSQCQTVNLDALHAQQVLALQWLQREMQDIVTRGVKGNLAEANRVLASIIQLMTCEVAIAKPGNWIMHMDAATELFSEIMCKYATNDTGRPCFMLVLLQLGSTPFTWTPKTHPWGSDQAILRFFTAQLLFLDTLGSTALRQPPRLHRWHEYLLMKPEEGAWNDMPASEKEQTIPHINLREFVGVENWVVVAIGEIAALDAWKKEMKRAASLSISQLVARAAAIEQRLRGSLQAFEDPCCEQSDPASAAGPQHHLVQYFAGTFSPQIMHGPDLNTRIWAQAAITYLNVVLSGWQPSSPEIRSSVTQTIGMLSQLPSPDCVRTLVWPFTVTGCLAAPDQEHIFRNMVAGMGPLKVFGTVREGFAIMEKVWERRAEIDQDPEHWDLAACLNCLCQPALLI